MTRFVTTRSRSRSAARDPVLSRESAQTAVNRRVQLSDNIHERPRQTRPLVTTAVQATDDSGESGALERNQS